MAKDVDQKPIDSSHSPYSDDNAPNVTQLSTGQAIRELPGQYFKVLTRPSVTRFAEEKGKASWGIVWVQLISLAIIDAILQIVGFQMLPPNPSSLAGVNSISPSMLQSTIPPFLESPGLSHGEETMAVRRQSSSLISTI